MMQGCLLLEDGTLFEGRGFGAEGVRFGEVIFSTSMTGYQELLTDPSYRGQILVSTLAHVGNVGINAEDHESRAAWLEGFVVQDAPRKYSNWRAKVGLGRWLAEQDVVSLCDIDTRAVVKHLRERGSMRGAVCSGPCPENLLQQVLESPHLKDCNLVDQVTTPEILTRGESPLHVVAYDFGMKNYMVDLLLAEGLKVTVVPARTKAAEVMAMQPQGIFLSNGPGDPSTLPDIVQEVQAFLGKMPIFGICLGHQLLSRALGADTFKLKFGHHGTNHPVKDLHTGRVEITTQNHGYAVNPDTLPAHAHQTHINLNDGTCEGMSVPELSAFSVQYHPENAPGPQDSRYLFERFLHNLKAVQYA